MNNNQKLNIDNNQNTPKQSKPMKAPKKTSAMTWVWIVLAVLLFFMVISAMLQPTYVDVVGTYPTWSSYVSTLPAGSPASADPSTLIASIYDYGQYGPRVILTVQANNFVYVFRFDTIDSLNAFIDGVNFGATTFVDPYRTTFLGFILSLLPWVLIIGGSYWIMKMAMKQQGSIAQMNKKSLAPQMSNIKFDNIAGYDEVKAELWEIVDFLKNPSKYNDAGARTPKGVMLSGPPGTGKTFFAKAVAGEAGIPFYSLSGSDFVEMFVGVGAKRVRELFAQAKVTAPSLIFIDELDAVGRSRGSGMGGGNDEREQTLNQLLVEMDGFASNTGIVVMAATNRPDVLDPALKRPGRFDRAIDFRMPDILERQSILEIYAKDGRKKISPEVDWANIAARTPGFSAAELENVVNEAAILSIRLRAKEITLEILDESIDRVIGGPSKSNNLMSQEEKELVAYHESGHALIGLVMPKAEKVQKITIVPRGNAGGYVLMTPKKEKFVQTKSELEAKIVSYMGGRAAEEFFFGKEEISTGAYSDIEEATKIARRMVTEFGMSSLGPVQWEKLQGSMYLGGSSVDKKYGGQVGAEIDQEVRRMIDESYKTAFGIISKNKPLMNLFAEALLIKETLTAEEAEFIFENKKLPEHVDAMKVKKTSKAKKEETTPAKKSEPKTSTKQSTSKTKEEDKTK